MVDRQQIPCRWEPEVSQGLLCRQAGRHRPGPALDHHGHRRPLQEQRPINQGDQCGGQPQQQPRPAGQPKLAGRRQRGASAAAVEIARLMVLGRAGRRLQPTTPMKAAKSINA